MLRSRQKKPARSPAMLLVPLFALDSLLSRVRNGELQARTNQIGIRNLVSVSGVNLLPLARVAVELLGDLAEVVALLDGVGRRPGRSRRRSPGVDVGEVRRS